MTEATDNPTPRGEPGRGKGSHTREQLLLEATFVFAAKGYAAATTREICERAGANVAAISYHFGDKAGLYRAVLTHAVRRVTDRLGNFDDPTLPLPEALRRLFAPFIDIALAEGDELNQVSRLYQREILEPSETFREVVLETIRPQHTAVTALLARACALARPDEELQQLAFAVMAIARDYCQSREYMRLLAPELLSPPGARDLILNRLTGYALALIEDERTRRAPAVASNPPRHRRS